MLSNYPVAAILPITDAKRSKKFYQDTLGLRLIELPGPDDLLMFEAGKGTSLVLYTRPPVKVEHTQVGFNVDDVEKVVKELREKGVEFEEYDMPGLKTVKGIATMEGSKSAWFKDPDGNTLSINQM